MNAELRINYGRDDDDIFTKLFASEDQMFYDISLCVDGNTLSTITETTMDAIHEILDINDDTEAFVLDRNRLLTILVKYNKHPRCIEFKKLLRPLIRHDIKDIKIIKG